jgi:hypothetical protein
MRWRRQKWTLMSRRLRMTWPSTLHEQLAYRGANPGICTRSGMIRKTKSRCRLRKPLATGFELSNVAGSAIAKREVWDLLVRSRAREPSREHATTGMHLHDYAVIGSCSAPGAAGALAVPRIRGHRFAQEKVQ